MNALEIMLKSFGISPEVLKQTQQLFIDLADRVERIEAQLTRIEVNTNLILQDGGDTVAAGPTRYDIMPILNNLPPMNGEAKPT